MAGSSCPLLALPASILFLFAAHVAGDEGRVVAVGKKAGQEFYQNMCMKAVNQCIGRAIRHVADYAGETEAQRQGDGWEIDTGTRRARG